MISQAISWHSPKLTMSLDVLAGFETGPLAWSWARLLGHVFALDMAPCPFCRCGSLRIIAAITQESVITRVLRHLKLASAPPPIAPTRARQETLDWVA